PLAESGYHPVLPLSELAINWVTAVGIAQNHYDRAFQRDFAKRRALLEGTPATGVPFKPEEVARLLNHLIANREQVIQSSKQLLNDPDLPPALRIPVNSVTLKVQDAPVQHLKKVTAPPGAGLG